GPPWLGQTSPWRARSVKTHRLRVVLRR
ncbi:hypothetical protein WJX73_007768, partial [Symbiochloris irregularis]